MGILDGVIETLTGGLGGKIVDVVSAHFPPDMTPAQKAAIQLEIDRQIFATKQQAIEAQYKAEQLVNERIAMYEGTASDLKAIPIIGPILLTLRGAQRIVWGFGTLWLDFNVFSGSWRVTEPTIQSAFWVVNLLVGGFLFGERAVTNVMPYVTDMIKAKQPRKE